MLLCVFIAAVLYLQSSARMGLLLVGHSPGVISRLNYGIYFRKIATLDISSQTWTHIFRVQIPIIKVSSPQISYACSESARSPQFCQGHTAARRLIMNAYRTVVKMYEKLNSDIVISIPESSNNWRNTSKPKRNVFYEIGGFVGK
jgi:hypothetical protein